MPKVTLAKSLEGVCLFVIAALVGFCIFLGSASISSNLYIRFPYMLFPVVIWSALRFGIRTTSSLCLIIAVLAISRTISGDAPFTGETLMEQLLYLQLFLGVLSATGLILSASINEKTHSAQMVISKERDLSVLVNQIKIGIAQTDLFGHFYLVNEKFCEILGRSKAEILKLRFHDIVHSQDITKSVQIFSELRKSGEESVGEQRLIRSDGKELWVYYGISGVRDNDGRLISAVAIVQDITARKLTEAALVASEERLRLATESTGTGIWDWDVETGRLECTDRFKQIFGLEGSSGLNQLNIMNVVDADYRDDVYQSLINAMRGRPSKSFKIEYKIKTKEGNERWVASRGHAFVDGSGRAERVIGTALDITERKNAEQELLVAKESADKASKAKSDFLAHVSHEIRTPLGIMLGFADLLKGGNLTPAEHEHYVEMLVNNGQHLLALINDLLDLSKVESGKFLTEMLNIRLRNFIQDLESVLTPKADAKGISLEFTLEESVPEAIMSDPVRLRQILINLVGNAIKFTDHGGVTVIVRQEKHEDSPADTLFFYVIDTGCGISPETQKQLFQAFSQGDASMTRKFGGTGLGLVLSKRVANFLGGDVTLVESAPGKGSTFLLKLSYQPASVDQIVPTSATTQSKKSSNTLNNLKVLVVDDMKDNQDLLKHYLSYAGAVVDIASDGLEGINKAQKQDFDLVLMDLQMPGCDGYEATRRLRHSGYRKPIVALTAHAMKKELDDCIRVGCDAHLTKPVTFDTLLETIERFC